MQTTTAVCTCTWCGVHQDGHLRTYVQVIRAIRQHHLQLKFIFKINIYNKIVHGEYAHFVKIYHSVDFSGLCFQSVIPL